MLTENSNFDVSKFYARGLHLGFIIFCSIIKNEYEKLLK